MIIAVALATAQICVLLLLIFLLCGGEVTLQRDIIATLCRLSAPDFLHVFGIIIRFIPRKDR